VGRCRFSVTKDSRGCGAANRAASLLGAQVGGQRQGFSRTSKTVVGAACEVYWVPYALTNALSVVVHNACSDSGNVQVSAQLPLGLPE